MKKKRKRKTRLDKEIEYNIKKLGMGQWQAFKQAWHKLYGGK